MLNTSFSFIDFVFVLFIRSSCFVHLSMLIMTICISLLVRFSMIVDVVEDILEEYWKVVVELGLLLFGFVFHCLYLR